MSERRRFLVTAGAVRAGMTAVPIVDAPNVIAQPKVQWRLSTAYPASLDTHHGAALHLDASLPLDMRQTLNHAAAATEVYALTEYHLKNAAALERLRVELKGKVEVIQFPAAVLRASFTRFRSLLGAWDQLAEGAHHRFVLG